MNGLAAWGHKGGAAGVPTPEAMQPVAAGMAGLGGMVEAAGAEEVGVENLSPVHHNAWEADRLRALGGVLGEELQPEGLLLGVVETPWHGFQKTFVCLPPPAAISVE